MVEIYLCRHGQSVANSQGILAGHIDSPLNEVGRAQAQELALLAKKANLHFDHVYTSPLSRAKETVEIIAKATNSPTPELIDDLIERDFGVLTGRHYTDIEKFSKDILRADNIFYFLEAKDSEIFPKLLQRAQRVLKHITQRHHKGKILLVAHGDIGMMLFAAFHSTPWKEALTHFHFGNCELLLLHEDSQHKPHVFSIDQRGLKEKA